MFVRVSVWTHTMRVHTHSNNKSSNCGFQNELISHTGAFGLETSQVVGLCSLQTNKRENPHGEWKTIRPNEMNMILNCLHSSLVATGRHTGTQTIDSRTLIFMLPGLCNAGKTARYIKNSHTAKPSERSHVPGMWWMWTAKEKRGKEKHPRRVVIAF